MQWVSLFRGKPPEPVTAAEEEEARKRTLKLSIVEGSIWSFMAGFGDMYVSPFAIFLKAGNGAIAFLATMPALLGAVAQIAGASSADRFGRRRAVIVPLATCQALVFLPMFFVPLIWRSMAVPALLLFAAIGVACAHGGVPAWTSLMGDVVPATTRGDYFGKRGRLVIMMTFLASLMAGGLLYLFQQADLLWIGFGLLFSAACVARLLSARLLYLHYAPPYRPSPDDYFSFWDFIRRMPRSNFARFALFFALMMGAINVGSPFFNVYMLRDLGWSYAMFTGNIAMLLATQFVAIRWWGRLGDRHGNRAVLAATALILPVLPLLWLFSTNYFYLLCVQMVAGFGWSGFSIGAQNFTLDAVTPHKRARIASYTSLLNGVFVVLGGTVVGAWLANHLPSEYTLGPHTLTLVSPLQGVFVISSVLRMVAVLFLFRLFKEVRDAEPIHPIILILRASGGSAIAGFLSQSVLRLAALRRHRGGKEG